MSTPELGSSRTQPLNPKVSARPDQDWRDLCAIRREHVREERFRRADSQWRKRCAAITSGRFRGADGFTDEKALDAYAPHETDGLADRHFSAEAERRELDAWSLVEAARQADRRQHVDACLAYLRLAEALERAAEQPLRSKPLARFAGFTGGLKLKGAMRVRRAA